MSGAAGALDLPQDPTSDLEHEFDLIRSAVALLASGGARRVTLIGLALDLDALRDARSLVSASGMSLRATWGPAGCDITLEAGG